MAINWSLGTLTSRWSRGGDAQAQPQTLQRDRYPLVVAAVALILALGSYAYYSSQGLTLAYNDAQSRLLITRRIVDSPTPGLAQLGGVWPPLTHILAIPLIGNDFLYRTGLALSLISMLAFVLTAIYLYKMLVVLTGDRGAGLIAVFIFVSNPNMLYMQSTSMTEMPMYCSLVAAVYYLLRLTREPDNRVWYFASGLTTALSTLTRYEGWILLALEIVILLYVFLKNKFGLRKIEGLLIYWGYWALAGIAAWVVWNWLIFGDPWAFQRGEYAQPSLWVAANDSVIGHLDTSFWTYFYATVANAGPIFFLGLFGLVYYVVHTRLKTESIAPLALFGIFPAFVAMLYLGQRPLKVPEISGYMYNVRFALVMLLPMIIVVAYLTQRSLLPKLLVAIITVGCVALTLRTYGVITVREPVSVMDTSADQEIREAAAWLSQHYDNKPLLLESYGNTLVQFESHIPLRHLIYEGSYKIWDQALAKPQEYVDWVLMRNASTDNGSTTPVDKVWGHWHDSAEFHQRFELVYQNSALEIYHKRTS